MPEPGEVFYLPPDASEPEGKGDRPVILLSLCRPDSELATLAYGSTSNRDAAFGAEHTLINPSAKAHLRTGFIHPTYVYSSRLVTATPGQLRRPAGRITNDLPVIRASLIRALGLGTGVTREPNVPRANRRGRLAEFTTSARLEWECSHALVITEPEYSRSGYLQTVVPLLNGTFEAYDLDIVLEDTAWLRVLAEDEAAILAVPAVATLFLPTHIVRFTDIVAPPEVMTAVEWALRTHFGLDGYI